LGRRAVATELGLSGKTVETYRERINEKLHLPNGAELQRRAILSHGAQNGAET
jgi:DNA-binding NarL/FixJ family response regulator